MNPTQRNTLLILLVLVIVCGGTALYFFRKYNALKEAAPMSQAEVEALVEEVGRIILLPEGETPTIATVADPALLQDQSFFRNAKRGDKVLVYPQAGRAILYDPIAKRIIDVASINLEPASPATPAESQQISDLAPEPEEGSEVESETQ